MRGKTGESLLLRLKAHHAECNLCVNDNPEKIY